jgi:hypothetical protein
MRTRPFIIAALLAVLAMPAFAQAPAGTPTNIRGKVVKLDGNNLTVKTREGPTIMVALAANTGVRALVKKKLSDIKAGDYVASTSMPGKDGKLHAVEVHYLPPAAPELQIPYDYKPGSVMTNAHVTGIAKGQKGSTLTMTYKGSTADIVVDPKTVIVTSADAAMTDLKPGKAVFLRATKAADGTITANNATVEKDGVKPPM